MSAILFELGETTLSPGAQDALEEAGQSAREFLLRHAQGDWGEIQECDANYNQEAVYNKGEVFSTYKLLNGTEINIKTDIKKKQTNVYLPGGD